MHIWLMATSLFAWAHEGPALPPLTAMGERPEGCTADPQFPELLAPKQRGGATVEVAAEPGRTVESFVFRNGIAARVVQGGCAHYGLSAMFALREVPTDPRATALKLLGQLKVVRPPFTLLTILKAAPELGPHGTFPCGDAICSMRLLEDQGHPLLIVDYDFPL